jgi:hypothetical protein
MKMRTGANSQSRIVAMRLSILRGRFAYGLTRPDDSEVLLRQNEGDWVERLSGRNALICNWWVTACA